MALIYNNNILYSERFNYSTENNNNRNIRSLSSHHCKWRRVCGIHMHICIVQYLQGITIQTHGITIVYFDRNGNLAKNFFLVYSIWRCFQWMCTSLGSWQLEDARKNINIMGKCVGRTNVRAIANTSIFQIRPRCMAVRLVPSAMCKKTHDQNENNNHHTQIHTNEVEKFDGKRNCISLFAYSETR